MDENFDILSDDNDNENKVIEQAPNLLPEIHKVLVLVRKIVVAFKRFPLKTDTLKQYFNDEFSQELVLILVLKTRWNSMFGSRLDCHDSKIY